MSIFENCPQYIRKQLLEQYAIFAIKKHYPIDSASIHPLHVMQWIFELYKTEKPEYIPQNTKNTFYYLIRNSKYPLSLFLKISHIEKLISQCTTVNFDFFSDLFDLFLRASRQYATNPWGSELIKQLPSTLPSNREPFKGWFLTKTNECFKMLSVVDFYIWLNQNKHDTNFNREYLQLSNYLKDYLNYMKHEFSKGKYKKKRIFISYVIRLINSQEDSKILFVQKPLDNNPESVSPKEHPLKKQKDSFGKKVLNLETEIKRVEKLLQSPETKNKIMLSVKLSRLNKDLCYLKEM